MTATVTSINKHRILPFAKIDGGIIEQPALPFYETAESILFNIHGVVNSAALNSSDPKHLVEVRILQSLMPVLTMSEATDLLFRFVNETLNEGDEFCATTIRRAVNQYLEVRDRPGA